MATSLSINLNKIALLRNQRGLSYPSVVDAAQICLSSGAVGITVHPRPDGRHIRFPDLLVLSRLVALRPGSEFNIEGNPNDPRWLEAVLDNKPHQATFVPDDPDQVTSDHGFDIPKSVDQLAPLVRVLKDANIRVAVFVDANAHEHFPLLADLGVDRVELYTEPYSTAFIRGGGLSSLPDFTTAAAAAIDCGLGVNAGHDLTADNLPGFLHALPRVDEVSIGHWVASQAIFDGLARVVARLAFICER